MTIPRLKMTHLVNFDFFLVSLLPRAPGRADGLRCLISFFSCVPHFQAKMPRDP